MGSKTSIEWTRGDDGSAGATWNPVRARNLATGKVGWHCEHVSEGCRNCYSESMNRRLGTGLDFKPGHRADVEIFLDEKMLLAPLRWKKPRRIFVNSMTDTFAEFVKDEWIDRMFAVMALCPQHTFQVLTKRPGRMQTYCCDPQSQRIWRLACNMGQPGRALSATLAKFGSPWPLPNIWLGISAEDQATADERIPLLLQTPAAVRFVSLEPLLGPINLTRMKLGGGWYDVLGGWRDVKERFPGFDEQIDWVIVGGESGPHARPMNPQWARDIRDQCKAAGVAFFHKQNGEYASVSEVEGEGAHFHFDDGCTVRRVGKRAAGRLLDGIEHNGMPA